jgi:AcrR family transcriptional regulator
MPKAKAANSRARILDAAERAFADLGLSGASLRRIVRGARVNLATVYYYFGSKDGLMAAVFERRLGPLKQEHLKLLRDIEQAARGRPLSVEQVLEAMLLPPLRLAGTASARSQAVMRLVGRLVTEPNPKIQEMLHRRHREVREAFVAAMRRSLPETPEADLRWRFTLLWGALAFVLCNRAKPEDMPKECCKPADTKTVLAQMMAMFSAGFRAPPAGRTNWVGDFHHHCIQPAHRILQA